MRGSGQCVQTHSPTHTLSRAITQTYACTAHTPAKKQHTHRHTHARARAHSRTLAHATTYHGHDCVDLVRSSIRNILGEPIYPGRIQRCCRVGHAANTPVWKSCSKGVSNSSSCFGVCLEFV